MEANRDAIVHQAILSELRVVAGKSPQGGGGLQSTALFDVRVPYSADATDLAAERLRLKKEMEGLQKAITSKENQLGNETFRSKAPEKIIQQMKATGDYFKAGEIHDLKLQEVQFEGLAFSFGEFFRRAVHRGSEIAIARGRTMAKDLGYPPDLRAGLSQA